MNKKITETFKKYQLSLNGEQNRANLEGALRLAKESGISFDAVIGDSIKVNGEPGLVAEREGKIIKINFKGSKKKELAILIDEKDASLSVEPEANVSILLLANCKKLSVVAKGELNFILFNNFLEEISIDAREHSNVSFNIMPISKNSAKLRISSKANEYSSLSINEILILDGNQKIDSEIISFLEGQNSRVNINSRALLYGNSLCMLKGYIESEENSKGSISSLSQSAMLLSKEAHADSIPVMSIKTNDVQASHESFIVPINDEITFFAESRGINNKNFKRLVAHGFVESLLEKINNKKGRGLAMSIVKEKIDGVSNDV